MKSHSHQLLALAHVMQEGSFSAAAQKMNVTQSALSQHVKKLEQSVGSKLLIRRPSGLELTHAGAEIFQLAAQLASLTDEIDARIDGYGHFDVGHLNIVANAPQPALSLIAQYSQHFPNVEISFTLFDWTRAMNSLTDHSVDVALITDPRMVDDCIYKKLLDTNYVLYVPKGHAFSNRTTVHLRELEEQTLILPEKGSLTQRIVAQALGKHSVTPRRRMITTTFPVMKEAVLNGIGVGIFLANAAAPSDDLVELEIPEIDKTFEVYAVLPKPKSKLRLVRTFWDSLDEVSG